MRGFTLIEVTVVVMIIAILSSVMVPAWSRYQERARFARSVEDVAGLLRWSREAARSTNADVVVRFDSQTDTFAASVQAAEAGPDQPVALATTQEAAAPAPRIVSLGEDAAVVGLWVNEQQAGLGQRTGQSTGDGFAFHEDGSADHVRIAFQSRQGRLVGLEVYPATGRVAASEADR